MSVDTSAFGSAYADFLAELWEDLDDLLESHYGARVRLDDDRLRMRLAELRLRLVVAMDQAEALLRCGDRVAASNAQRMLAFGAELLGLLQFEPHDDGFTLGCGSTMVRAQNRILDEERSVAAAS